MSEDYATHARGIRIVPGQWRPHYPFEQIAWVSPPWPSQDYLWLDFPEAIFADQGLLYLSHVNPAFPSRFDKLTRVPWRIDGAGISFERTLPNGIRFGGRVGYESERSVSLSLYLDNGSAGPLTCIKLQTCLFLRACREFADYTLDNKWVHVPGKGWIPYPQAQRETEESGTYRLGWRGGPAIADWPVMVTRSNQGERWVAMTWHTDTYSLVGNPDHPCMHADPRFPDLDAGQRATIQGHLYFFEGTLDAFAEACPGMQLEGTGL